MRFYGHSGDRPDKSDWQPLAEHLTEVARLARERAAGLPIEEAAAVAGLLHDVGKYTVAYQRRLEGGRPVDHSTAGARIALDRAGAPRWLSELIAYAILGHHAGLPDRVEGAASFARRLEGFRLDLNPVWTRELTAPLAFPLDGAARPRGENAAFETACLGRLLFSCLVDADHVETERHFAQVKGEAVDRDWPELSALLPDFIARFDAHMAGKDADGPVNALRGEVLRHARARADAQRGVFTLTVPTGGGKTLASLGFALDHARAHGLKRIVYAIPYTSIIDQTVDEFRKVLGEDMVLAHHSAIEDDKPDPLGARELRDKRRLAMEDWAAPVIVTTNVQLFESLFAARPSRARKLRNLVDGVIVLDEAQTLPRKLLTPTLRMIEALKTQFRASVVLCTATQPAFDRRKFKAGLELDGRELAPDPQALATRLRRVTLRDAGAMGDVALAAALAAERQGLVIVNSRRHALDLYRAAQAEGVGDLVHLSTRQCAAHRGALLAEIRRRLKAGEPVRVVSTSLVEAGVDLDFPALWRARAGLDQIVQAAGRCNREGRRDPAQSVVTIFDAPDHPPPAEIAGLIGDMGRMKDYPDLLSLEAIERYFREVYWRMGDRLDARRIMWDFGLPGRDQMATNFAYRAVAEKYRMIETGMEPVIVAFDDMARQAIAELAVEKRSSGALARALQPYVVQVPPRVRSLLLDNGHVAFAHPDLRGDQFAVLRWEGLYVADVGLVWENGDALPGDVEVIA